MIGSDRITPVLCAGRLIFKESMGMNRFVELDRIMTGLETLCERAGNRGGPAGDGDAPEAKINSVIFSDLMFARAFVASYHNFYKTYADRDGRIAPQHHQAHHEAFMHLSQAMVKLHHLARHKLAEDAKEPVHIGGLSRMFGAVVRRDRETIDDLRRGVCRIVEEDIAMLGIARKPESQPEKAPEKAAGKPRLFLVVSKPEKPDL